MKVLWRGTVTHKESPRIALALLRGMKRVGAWDNNSELRVQDVKTYLTWQLEAITDELAWHYGDPWRRKEKEEGSESETLDRRSDEVTVHVGRMLRCGTHDDFEWSDEVEEDALDLIEPERKKKRRRA